MAKSQPVEVPGAEPAPEALEAAPANESQAELIARLLQENAALKAAAGPAADTPSIVFTPETPHGREALASSPFGHMSAAEVLKGLQDGTIPQPVTAYLTRDGYVARLPSSGAR